MLFAACASPSDSTQAPADTQPASATAAPAGTDPAPGETGLTDPNVAEPGTIPVLKEKMSMVVGISEDSNIIDYKDNLITQWIEERTNVDIEFRKYPSKGSEARQIIELDINSKAKLPDVILGIINEAGRYNYGAAGALVELTPYYEKQGKFFFDAVAEAGLDAENDLFRYSRSPDGGLYGMMEWNPSLPNQFSNRAWINIDFLKTLGMEKPTTTEELYTFLKAVKDQDVNGNGIADDEIGILGSNNGWNANPLMWLLNAFIYMDYTDDYFFVKDGVLDVAYNKDEFREGLKFARRLADEGLLSSNSFTQDNAQYLSAINAEDPLVAIAVSGGTGGFNDRIFSYDAAAVIEGPAGVKNVTWTAPRPNVNAYITRDAQSPEAAFAFLSLGYADPEYSILRRFGEKDVNWVYAAEGEVGLYDDLGYQPSIRVLENVWGVTQKANWMSSNLPYIERYNVEAGLIVDADDPANASVLRNANAVREQMPYKPAETVVKIIYQSEETDAVTELRTAVRSYVKESVVQFVVGGIDPNSDSDWNAYLAELERLNYQQVLDTDRQAYARTMQ